MPLTLTIRNVAQLDNGSPVSLVLDRRGATIGRAATNDWCLPDPSLHISSRHCEVRYSGEQYELIDHSTNGTFLFGQSVRFAGPHVIAQGDVFAIGHYEVAASLDEAAAAAAASRNAGPAAPEWRGWSAAADPANAAPAASTSAWDAKPSGSAISGGGPMSQAWAPPAAAGPAPGGWGPAAGSDPALGFAPAASGGPAASSATDGWGAAAATPLTEPSGTWKGAAPPPPTPASDWSSPAAKALPPSGDDIWGKFAASNVVDWARGGFGSAPAQAAPLPAATPVTAAAAFGQAPPPPAPPTAAGFGQPPFSAPPAAPAVGGQTFPPAAAPNPASAVPPAAAAGAGVGNFLSAAGIDPARLKADETELLGRAGNVLRRLVAGLVVMLEARARAKSQLGAQGTNLEFDGNNPLKFARTPEQALTQLLNPAERGFMDSDRAIEDAFKDLQAHQMATLKAMQGALRATLDRFSPTAIRGRAEQGGLLGKILPASRDAALWKAYEREFGGVAQGSDEAFMDMFAKEFRRAYEEIAAKR